MPTKDRRAGSSLDYDEEVTFGTLNGTCWRSIKRHVVEDTTVRVWLVQEHHLSKQEEVDEASAWLRKRGMKSMWSKATAGVGKGTIGGVAIFADEALGLAPPSNGEAELEPGRLLCGMVECSGFRPMLCMSAYFVVGQGLGYQNMELLQKIGACACSEPAYFVVGGDFNAGPSQLEHSGFLERAGATVFKSRAATCFTKSSSSEIDFFIGSSELSHTLK